MYKRQREVKKEDKVENSWLSVTSKEQNTKHEDECKHRNLLHITFVKGIGHAFTIQKIAKFTSRKHYAEIGVSELYRHSLVKIIEMWFFGFIDSLLVKLFILILKMSVISVQYTNETTTFYVEIRLLKTGMKEWEVC